MPLSIKRSVGEAIYVEVAEIGTLTILIKHVALKKVEMDIIGPPSFEIRRSPRPQVEEPIYCQCGTICVNKTCPKCGY